MITSYKIVIHVGFNDGKCKVLQVDVCAPVVDLEPSNLE